MEDSPALCSLCEEPMDLPGSLNNGGNGGHSVWMCMNKKCVRYGLLAGLCTPSPHKKPSPDAIQKNKESKCACIVSGHCISKGIHQCNHHRNTEKGEEKR